MMNCCDEYGNCRQGRDCPVRKELMLKKRSLLLDVMEGVVTLATIIGIITAGCMLLGYVWYLK